MRVLPENYITSLAGELHFEERQFEKLRFRDGLVRTECLTGEIKLHFQCVNSEGPSIRLARQGKSPGNEVGG